MKDLNLPQYVFGGDSSHWQDDNTTPQTPDFNKADMNGWEFCYMKASQGVWIDSDYKLNWSNARETKLLLGAYHFLQWDIDPVRQAQFFWDTVKSDPGELPLICDFEWWSTIPPNAFDILYRFLEELKRLINLSGKKIRVGIYTGSAFWKQYGKTDPYWKQYVLWLAYYTTTPPTGSAIPLPWTKVDFWQYTSKGDGPFYGMESLGVDLDYYLGSWEELLALCNKEGDVPVYETNALGFYINSNRNVLDWDLLSKQADVAFIRAAYVPLTKWTDGLSYSNVDTAKVYDDLLKEDPDYKSNYIKAKQKGMKVIPVIEFSPGFDTDSDYATDYQVKHIKQILMGAGDYSGDGICLQVLLYQFIQNSKVTSVPATNFKLAVQTLITDLFKEFWGKKTILVWSQSQVIKKSDYLPEMTVMFDNLNKGEPSYSCSFTYLNTAWRAVMGQEKATVREIANLAPVLTSTETNSFLKIGSYTGFGSKNATNTLSNHAFWGLFGCYLPYVKSDTGTPVYVEVLVWDTDKTNLAKFMGWTDVVTPPPSPELEKRITAVEAEMSTMRVQIASLITDIASLKTADTTFDTDIDALFTRLDNLVKLLKSAK